MKINKLIAKGLALGFLLNSASILSYANTEIPNRYQTIEGEYITIDDSMEGNLEEIEIFGNTVQDPNNLEDIQSVGNLYVDENGNPILDKQGREQYKIEIKTSNSNIFNEVLLDKNTVSNNMSGLTTFIDEDNVINISGVYENKDWYWLNLYNLKLGSSWGGTIENAGYQLLKPNTTYTLCAQYIQYESTDNLKNFEINITDENTYTGGFHLALNQDKTISSRTFNTSEYITSLKMNTKIKTAYAKEGATYNHKIRVWLVEGDEALPYESPKNDSKTILLPAQLEKVGDISDKLYWDIDKNRYVIEKNINRYTITGNEYIKRDVQGDNEINTVGFAIEVPNSKVYNGYSSNIISSKFNVSVDHGIDLERISIGWGKGNIFIRINKSRLNSESVKDFSDWLSFNNIEVLYQKENSTLIDTNITSKLAIPTCDDKTHIYVNSENGINPTLKVTVDRLPQIAKEAVIQAERDNTTHNIALARRYINMLPESSYKDQLQNQLSDVFSSDIVLDRKTATSNLDVYIKSENILQMSLDTNSISFDDFSGIEDVEKINAVNLTINSSLPYKINAYLPTEIQNSDKTKTLDKSILNIKENSESAYQTFNNTTDKIVLKDNCSSGNQLTHGVDLKLAGGIAHEKDVYKAIIKLEVEQK